ncbi:MAG: Verru_Chthon cassette protein A, partial [Verrucomicrobiaceae bacterium]
HGVALVLVLLFVVIISGLVVAFFSNVTTESMGARSYASGASTKLLADSAVHLVEAQLRDATRARTDSADPATALSWTSQPGLVRTFDSTGNAADVYKLYSSDTMVLSAESYTPDDPGIDPDPDLWTDLNAPEADMYGRLIYPIVYPPAETGGAPGATEQVEGFSITSPPNYKPGQAASALNNPAPMPVKWIYVLQDGTMSAAEKSDDEVVSVPGATDLNPIVGRIAFWADDECTKVNINTASEGIYWDVPRVYSMEDFGVHNGGSATVPGLAITQPAQREWQRYPGHPATTSLSPIFGRVFPIVPPVLTAATSVRLNPYYELAPRIVTGGSRGGTVIPTAPLTADRDRLYASIDELMFSTKLAGESRIPNTATGNSPEPNLITREVLEKAKFFITANSSAPETTLFNTPRISVWPVNVSDSRRTGYDKLAAFCSTIGGQPYYFTRLNARSSTQDFTARNKELYEYLQALTDTKVPGYGGTFLQKYPIGSAGATERDQILTYIYDYIRCTNLQDRSTGAMSYTPVYVNGNSTNAGEVLPIRIGNTQGFGRFYSISEADLIFYGTKATAGRTDRMRALFALEFASPMQGLGAMRSNLKYTVKGLDKLQVKVGDGGWVSMGFRPTGTNFMDRSDLDTYHGRSLGGTEGPSQALVQSNGSIKN